MLSAPPRPSYQINHAAREGDGLLLRSQRGLLRLQPCSEGILRVTYTEEASFSREQSLGISFRGIFSGWEWEEDDASITLRMPGLTASVDRTTGSVTYFSAAGDLLLRERDHESKQLVAFDAYRPAPGEQLQVRETVTPDGVKKTVVQAPQIFDRQLYHTRLNLSFGPDEHIFGLGQGTHGLLDLRHERLYLHQANMQIPIPFFLSSRGYGILSATDGAAIFSDDAHGSYFYTDADRELDFYFIYGPEFDDIIRGYRLLTGRAAMLPRWAFGFIQSQERYGSSEELLRIANGFRERGLGLDCLVLDWNSWRPGCWGEKSMDPECFPDVPELISNLREQDVELMLSIWPNPSEQTRDYLEFSREGKLLPGTNIYNAFDPEARQIYVRQLQRELLPNGLRAFWCDASEPFSPEWVEGEPEPAELYAEYIRTVSASIPRDRTDAYSLMHAQTVWEGLRAWSREHRVCNLTRSAHTGSQRYGTVLWSGDTSASWETLRRQIPAGLNFCASGLPFWTFDIGAFFVRQGPQWFWNGQYPDGAADLGYRELFVRWFQLGAFLPVFRSHGTEVRREPWNFGDPGEPFYEAIRAAIELRYRLMPYIYSAAADAALRDGTMLRMLAFDFRQDPQALEITDQFMFGKSILVCPVTHPILYTRSSEPIRDPEPFRRVYLPKGTGWYDFYTRERYEGGRWIRVPITIGAIPLFVREGSILPVKAPAESTARSSSLPLEYMVFPGEKTEGIVYEDSGNGDGWERGEYTWTKLIWDPESDEVRKEPL